MTPPRAPQTDELIELALASLDLFHDRDGTPFATFTVGTRYETVEVRGSSFVEHLARLYYADKRMAASENALEAARQHCAAVATFEGPERLVAVRVGHAEGAIFVDLADDEGDIIKVTPGCWSRIGSHDSPVRFRRPRGTLPLPIPTRGGSLDVLRKFVNLPDEDAWILVRAWLVATLTKGPYAILAFGGTQDSGKSSTTRHLRNVLDPRTSGLRRFPKDEQGLFIAARQSHVLAFDNLSGVPPAIADALCVLAYGEGFAQRKLYSDADEFTFGGARPVIANGIDDIATRPDLRDRSIVLSLPSLDERHRRTEEELRVAFASAHPAILGALLEAAAVGLRNLPNARLDRLPRMGDFARWSVACEPAFGQPAGSFLQAYRRSRDEAAHIAVETSSVAGAIEAWISRYPAGWSGNATELRAELEDVADTESPDWPRGLKAFANAVRRVAPPLRAVGIEVALPTKATGRAHRREFRFHRIAHPSAHDANDAHDAPPPQGTLAQAG
jgi:hypothetical protein